MIIDNHLVRFKLDEIRSFERKIVSLPTDCLDVGDQEAATFMTEHYPEDKAETEKQLAIDRDI